MNVASVTVAPNPSTHTRVLQELPGSVAWDEFFARLDAIGHEAREQVGQEDVRHLRRMEWIGRLCSVIGYATAWLAPNPLSALAISQGIVTRWLLMHHVGHQAYDNIPNIPARYTSSHFAMGRRRFLDWFDWMLPEAWNYEHNRLHHYSLNERHDPDLVQRNAAWLRNRPVPRWLGWMLILLVAGSWKFFYYAPNTLAELEARKRTAAVRKVSRNQSGRQPVPTDIDGPEVGAAYARRHFHTLLRADVWLTCLLPYATLRFGIIPALFLPLGTWAWASVLLNSVLAEILTNMHTFLVIVPNHVGDDMPSFEEPTASFREFQIRQILGSVNYRTGGDWNDYWHMWLNYQIEHHVWPKLTMRGYQRVQPRLRALCTEYGVPYIQQSVFIRMRRTCEIILGDTTMPHITGQIAAQTNQTPAIDHRVPA